MEKKMGFFEKLKNAAAGPGARLSGGFRQSKG